MENENTKRPAHEIRIGAIKAAIWANEGPNGTWHSVTFARVFKQANDWKQASNFNRDDLLTLAKVADQAHTWICEQKKEGAE